MLISKGRLLFILGFILLQLTLSLDLSRSCKVTELVPSREKLESLREGKTNLQNILQETEKYSSYSSFFL